LIPQLEPASAHGLGEVDERLQRRFRQQYGDAVAQAFVGKGREQRRQYGHAESFSQALDLIYCGRITLGDRQDHAGEIPIREHPQGVACRERSGHQPEKNEVWRSCVEGRVQVVLLCALICGEAELLQGLPEELSNVMLSISNADVRHGPLLIFHGSPSVANARMLQMRRAPKYGGLMTRKRRVR
jgi:hypothetical protein